MKKVILSALVIILFPLASQARRGNSFLKLNSYTGGAISTSFPSAQHPVQFVPTDVAGLVWWFKANLGPQVGSVVISSNSVAIDTWVNQSTNTINLTQTTGASQPLYMTNQVNSLPVIRFDGVNDIMATSAVTEKQPLMFFIVLKIIAGTDGRYLWDGLASTDKCAAWLFAGATGEAKLSAGSSACLVTYGVGSFVIITAQYNGASSSNQVNNNTAVTGDIGLGNPAGLTLGNLQGAGSASNIDVAEFIVYNTILSATNEASVESYLASKYAITLN